VGANPTGSLPSWKMVRQKSIHFVQKRLACVTRLHKGSTQNYKLMRFNKPAAYSTLHLRNYFERLRLWVKLPSKIH
jgi:hypothetical protein